MNITHNKKRREYRAVEGSLCLGFLRYIVPDDFSGKRNVEIDRLFVYSSFRGRGVGRALVERMLADNKNKEWISLWTGFGMEATKSYSFWKKMGFKQLAVQNDYYAPFVPTRLFARKGDTP